MAGVSAMVTAEERGGCCRSAEGRDVVEGGGWRRRQPALNYTTEIGSRGLRLVPSQASGHQGADKSRNNGRRTPPGRPRRRLSHLNALINSLGLGLSCRSPGAACHKVA